jgi:hypothetical protein
MARINDSDANISDIENVVITRIAILSYWKKPLIHASYG